MIGGVAVFAQVNQPIRGRVEEKLADGTSKPIEGAMVDMYRVDVKNKLPSDKTDKKGGFNFAGAPLGADLVLAISAPGYAPEVVPNIRAGRDDLVIVMRPGDGKRLTEAEVRAAVAAGNTNSTSTTQKPKEETAEEKQKREEYEKKLAEVKAKNEKAEKTNAIRDRVLKEGSAAYEAKNYDVAVAKFREGYEADPEFVSAAVVMLNNKGLSLLGRARETYNKAIISKAGMPEARESVKADLSEMISDAEKVLSLINANASTDVTQQGNFEGQRLMALANRKNAFGLMVETVADLSRGKEVLGVFQAYMAAEPDPAKKAKAQVQLADTLRQSMEYELAVVEYRKVLDSDANNVDATAGMGLCMVTIGYITLMGDPEKNIPANEAKGKQELQEAANVLQRFVDMAPADHKLLNDVKASIAELKNVNVAPQKGKTTTTTKKKN